jgi:DNA polymerase-3 subunit delta'
VVSTEQAVLEHVLPWHQQPWATLLRERSRVAHALLLSGQVGLGKRQFAERLARALLCAEPSDTGDACGRCRQCQLLAAGTHPDLARVEPAEEGKAIVVDQIRALGEFITTRPHSAERKVTIICPAEKMNINAANSLLKLLEEPPLGSVLILVSDRSAMLPPTVRSRCQRVDFRVPTRDAALTWLAAQGVAGDDAQILLDLAAGAPLQALAESDLLRERGQLLADIEALSAGEGDPVIVAAGWYKLGAGRCLAWLAAAVTDLIKLAMTEGEGVRLTNADLALRLHALGQGLNLKQLYGFADALAEARGLLTSPVDNLLLLEDILIRWINVRKKLRQQ